MSWRLAESLRVLQKELDAAYPNRTTPDWSIGDRRHARSASDHNPNSAGVVCAIDIRGGGIDLDAVANQIKSTNNTPVKYVIWNYHIWSKERDYAGWRRYYGSNPHTTHVHVSVGIGRDGQSRTTYDNLSPWGISDLGDEMYSLTGLEKGDKNDRVGLLQVLINYTGMLDELLVIDDDYGPKTAAGLLKVRDTVVLRMTDGERGTSSTHGGDLVTKHAIAQLLLALGMRY